MGLGCVIALYEISRAIVRLVTDFAAVFSEVQGLFEELHCVATIEGQSRVFDIYLKGE